MEDGVQQSLKKVLFLRQNYFVGWLGWAGLCWDRMRSNLIRSDLSQVPDSEAFSFYLRSLRSFYQRNIPLHFSLRWEYHIQLKVTLTN